MISNIYGDCLGYLNIVPHQGIDLTFLDPPFNQGKDYPGNDDSLPTAEYWHWMEEVCLAVYEHSSPGAAVYFMQREKNAAQVMTALTNSGWTFQNMIIWKKKTSAVPGRYRFGKHYQIIVFATKGAYPRVFNKLRIDPPLLETEKIRRPNGVFVTDVWDDIRELTSGYFAGDEPLRHPDGRRVHNQQSPIHLLTRIILSSSDRGDLVFDPFAGTGTTLVVAKQLNRDAIGCEIHKGYSHLIDTRLEVLRTSDDISRLYDYYRFTENLPGVWGLKPVPSEVTNDAIARI